MAIASLIISILALLFTLTAFWWLHARRGRVVAGRPFTWAGYSKPHGEARLRLPLAMANSGPVGIMITDLRATVRSDDLNALLPWVTERSSLRPVAEDLQDFAGPLLISGRNVTRHFVEFGGYGAEPAPLVSGATYEVTVEGLVSWATGRKAPEWNELFTVSIEGPPEKTRNNYIT